MTPIQQHLEQSLQQTLDAILRDDPSLAAALLLARSPAFATVSPSLSAWLLSVLPDTGHSNEQLINLDAWSDLDLACGVGAALALDRHSTTPAVAQLTLTLVELFAIATARRLTLHAVQRLEAA